MAKVIFSNVGPTPLECDARVGESILDVALNNDISMEHACGGFCACATCHIEVIGGLETLTAAEEDELERLEQVPRPTPQSRLACQAKITQAQCEVKVEIQNLI